MPKKMYSNKPILSNETPSGKGIPKVVYQTYKVKKLIPELNQAREKNRALNPEYRFELWDDTEIDRFIKKEFPPHVYRAFTRINPKYGASRADFWRYCILYAKGGVYLDMKTEIKTPLDEIFLPTEEALLDVPRALEKWRTGTYEQWFLAYSPGHPYLREMIEQMSQDILDGKIPECRPEYGCDCPCAKQIILNLTGPDAYTRAIENVISRSGVKHRTVPFDSFLNYGNDVAKHQQYQNSGSKHYSQLDEPIYTW